MSRATSTVLTNLCLVEDPTNGKVVLQYRSPERYKKWSGYAFPGGHIEEGESLVESVIREVYEETGLTITNPKLVAVKDWEPDEGGRYIVFCYKATEFTGQLRSSDEGEVSWVEKDQLEKLDLSYDMLPLLEVMEDSDLSEYYYRKRTDDDWEKLRF
ncbi:8-oxo-dGTP diphosphatase [Streptococcus parasanguinis]|mgnify:FL=1|uniref:8-oxo-dGTP diphosphatase n=1 Tax=Streptococcus parasanguinis TaxID=1318 RepID=UPI0013E99C05|nr:8-oxo-dGTP diphosphatase [Streptococcus parasanguinis]